MIIKKSIYLFLLFLIFSSNLLVKKIKGNTYELNNFENLKLSDKKEFKIADLKWEKLQYTENESKKKWIKYEINKYNSQTKNLDFDLIKNHTKINSLNRSVVFNNKIIGPDIGYLVPPGFKWNSKYKFDASVRGRNRRKKGEQFLSWNGGDAMGHFYYQAISNKGSSIGINLGIRSIYSGNAPGGGNNWGEGSSIGFRIDRELSTSSGFAFGAEQLIQFDNFSDTGRDIYITASKGWWNEKKEGNFPLTVGTIGFGTGKLAVGNIKGLCSNSFGGDGTEIAHRRRLCWAPVFSIARIHNPKISNFLEYNSKWFLLGTSIAPSNEIPLRGTFAVQISDHIDNYKINNFDNLKWVFRLNLGF